MKCNTCTGTSTNCQSCSDVNRDFSDSCNCKDGFYDNGTATCQACNYKCLTCSDGSTCTSCPSNRDPSSNCDCEDGYIELTAGSPTCT